MPVERREQVTRVETVRVNGQPEELAGFGTRRQLSLGETSRMNREIHVQICERLGVKFPGATRQTTKAPIDLQDLRRRLSPRFFAFVSNLASRTLLNSFLVKP
jgi:hypothetical protein